VQSLVVITLPVADPTWVSRDWVSPLLLATGRGLLAGNGGSLGSLAPKVTIHIEAGPSSCLLEVRRKGLTLAIAGIANTSAAARRLWPELTTLYQVQQQIVEHAFAPIAPKLPEAWPTPRKLPWLAISLSPLVALHAEAYDWLMPFLQAQAWAWLEETST
jgi:hypothetical protein